MALPFSASVTKNGFVFTSGQIYLTSQNELLEGTIEEQTHQVMKNLEGVLKQADVTFKDVVKTTIYITDMTIYDQVSNVYASYFTIPPLPVRETVCVKALPLGARVEISMIAAKP